MADSFQSSDDADSTEFKLAILASMRPDMSTDVLLDYLLAYQGNVSKVSDAITGKPEDVTRKRKYDATNGQQSSISAYTKKRKSDEEVPSSKSLAVASRLMPKKGKTLHLYDPKDIERTTPCSIIHNFLPKEQADALARELLDEVETFKRGTFQLFDRTVQSPHTWKFYVNSAEDVNEQKTQYRYDGLYEENVSQTPPVMLQVGDTVRDAVNAEIKRRIKDFHPHGQKLKFQALEDWQPNASFVNCYDGPKEHVGYHADQLTYLGPRAVIGSLSLGVTREFRVRQIVPQKSSSSADEQGQIAIHLPHNSLLVMHAEMQEGWKHSIAPTQAIDPHPLTGSKRLNITYRWYKPSLHPKYTPRCHCDVPCVLRCVQRRAVTRGRYMWMCFSNYTPGKKGCSFFVWAEFDEDGRPPWIDGYKGNANVPNTVEEEIADTE